jgi:hypothetical protein
MRKGFALALMLLIASSLFVSEAEASSKRRHHRNSYERVHKNRYQQPIRYRYNRHSDQRGRYDRYYRDRRYDRFIQYDRSVQYDKSRPDDFFNQNRPNDNWNLPTRNGYFGDEIRNRCDRGRREFCRY